MSCCSSGWCGICTSSCCCSGHPDAVRSSHHASRQSSGKIGGGRLVRGIPQSSTSTMGRMCCSRRRECTRRDRPASCGRPCFDGSHVPSITLVSLFDHAVECTYIRWGSVALEVWLDRLVLLVELSKIWDKILDDVGVRKWIDAGLL